MSKNTLNILVVSARSLSLARKIRDEYPGKTVIYCREADNDVEPFTSFKELTGNLFDKSETIVFIGAMGICVRSIAPYIKSKYTTRQSSASTVPANMSYRYYPVISVGRTN